MEITQGVDGDHTAFTLMRANRSVKLTRCCPEQLIRVCECNGDYHQSSVSGTVHLFDVVSHCSKAALAGAARDILLACGPGGCHEDCACDQVQRFATIIAFLYRDSRLRAQVAWI